MAHSSITIPNTIDDAVSVLNGIGGLLTAKEWERAAIVATFVEERAGQGVTSSKSGGSQLSATAFAGLGIRGLSSPSTVLTYARAWLDRFPRPKPGRAVKLPTDDWPPTRGSYEPWQTAEGARKTIERVIAAHGPDVVAQVVVDDADTHRAVIRESNARTPYHEPLVPKVSEPFARLTSRLFLEALVADARQMHKIVLRDFSGTYAWRPGELEHVLAHISSVEQMLSDIRAVLTNTVSDADLADLLRGE